MNYVADEINTTNTKFKDELNQNTKNPEEILNEKWLIESEKINKQAEFDYKHIKAQLLSNARSGDYLTVGDKKCVFFNFESKYTDKCINRKDQSTHTNKIFGGHELHGRVVYEINDYNQYNLYLTTLKKLASEDGILINPVFIEECDSITKNVNLPYTYTGRLIYLHKISAKLNCSIEY